MIEYKMIPNIYELIIKTEKEYYDKCVGVLENYVKKCCDLGCQLNYGLFWNGAENNYVYERPDFSEKYGCWFGYEIVKSGECVSVDEEGGTLGYSSGFLYVRKGNKFSLKLDDRKDKVIYIDSINDLIESIECDYLILKNFIEKQL